MCIKSTVLDKTVARKCMKNSTFHKHIDINIWLNKKKRNEYVYK